MKPVCEIFGEIPLIVTSRLEEERPRIDDWNTLFRPDLLHGFCILPCHVEIAVELILWRIKLPELLDPLVGVHGWRCEQDHTGLRGMELGLWVPHKLDQLAEVLLEFLDWYVLLLARNTGIVRAEPNREQLNLW